jgi:hypothetical protein
MAPTDHGCRRHPQAAMVPHTWRRCMRQSANILGDCFMQRRWEWGKMATAIDHLGHDALADVVGFCE